MSFVIFKQIFNNGKVGDLKDHMSASKAIYTHIWPIDIYLGETVYNSYSTAVTGHISG